jgi:hypothetical protein
LVAEGAAVKKAIRPDDPRAPKEPTPERQNSLAIVVRFAVIAAAAVAVVAFALKR